MNSDSDSDFDGFSDAGEESFNIGAENSDIDVSDPSSDDNSSDSSDEADFTDFQEPVWSSNKNEFLTPNIDAFIETSGPSLPAHLDVYNASPLDYFFLFVSDEVFQDLATHTNNYAKYRQELKSIVTPGYKDKDWFETTPPEMKAYMALNILFGLSPTRRIRHYWSKDKFLRNQGVAEIMSQRRFTKLTEYFHITDRNSEPAHGSPEYDCLFKVRSFMQRLQVLFPMMSQPTKEQTIDEGLQPFQGRDKKVQYLPDKPKKRGFKMWIRCDSETGYIQQFEIYTGKKVENAPSHSKNGATFDVLDTLTKPIQGKNHHVYFDNYYTSIPALLFLLSKNTYACGTIQSNRKYVPESLKEMKKAGQRGEIIMFQDKKQPNLTICGWRDTKVVKFASTQANPNLTCTAQRRSGSQYISVHQPHSASMYARFMGGVDTFDHLRERYRVGRPSKKAWKYLFFFLVDAALVNAYILYKQTSVRVGLVKNFDQFHFRMELIPLLVAGFTNRKMRTDVKPCKWSPENCAPTHSNVRLMGVGKQCSFHRKRVPQKPRHSTVYGCVLCGIHLCKECHQWSHK